jgi:hypothetical protein
MKLKLGLIAATLLAVSNTGLAEENPQPLLRPPLPDR